MLTYSEYLDKVYGCWLGKCVVGTVGAPYEGMKQMLNLQFDPKMIETMLPNDDLDLQVLWLSVLEEKGIYTTAEDLGRAFHEKNIYWPGEYAWFDRNYQRGIRPPYTGIYENDFYREGMGCPIRAEIWGLIAPGNPAIAARLCKMDGELDHNGNSVYFESFWAAMVAQAFVEDDLHKLIECGLRHIPADSRAAALIRDVVDWCAAYDDHRYIRSRIIAEYGHCDCTNSFQNIGITLMLLLKFSEDIRTLAVTACNCGFDTDCTAGNAGALVGLLRGGQSLERDAGFRDSGYVLTLHYRRRSDKIADLAQDTAAVALHFLHHYPGMRNILENCPEGAERKIDFTPHPVQLLNFYDEPPYIAPGESVCVRFEAASSLPAAKYAVSVVGPEGFRAESSVDEVVFGGGEKAAFTVTVTLNAGCRLLPERNLFTVRLEGGSVVAERTFGVIGKTAYRLFGPFWENNYEIKIEDTSKPYAYSIPAKSEEELADKLRFYHLNMLTDPEKEYMPLDAIRQDAPDAVRYERNGRTVYVCGDAFRVRDVTPFRGPCTVYLKRIIRLDEARSFRLYIGRSDAFRLYVNGEEIASRTGAENWTPENVHIIPLRLQAGDNEIVFRVCNRNGGDKYSLTFLEDRDCPPQTADLNSVIQEELG